MSAARIERDLKYLAGELPHRGANTDNERAAAEYIRNRFGEYTGNTGIEDFYSVESYYYLFASYYAEFFLVALVAFWSARLALCYGAVVFLAYLFEFTGHRTFSRLMPKFETQNVVARFFATRPKRTMIVSAHYDSPRDAVFTHPRVVPWLKTAHLCVVVSMLLILLTCATEAAGVFNGIGLPIEVALRWMAVGVLLSASLAMFYSAVRSDYVRGANGNASGVAALLTLAERLAESPLEETDVYLLATGSKDTWMSGMQHFINTHTIEPRTTYFLNLEHVGAGQLHYVLAEGMLSTFPSAPELVRAAESVAQTHAAAPHAHYALPTDAAIPLARGFKAMSIVALDASGVPPDWHWPSDTLMHVDTALIEKAADLAEAVIRRIETNLTRHSRNQSDATGSFGLR